MIGIKVKKLSILVFRVKGGCPDLIYNFLEYLPTISWKQMCIQLASLSKIQNCISEKTRKKIALFFLNLNERNEVCVLSFHHNVVVLYCCMPYGPITEKKTHVLGLLTWRLSGVRGVGYLTYLYYCNYVGCFTWTFFKAFEK